LESEITTLWGNLALHLRGDTIAGLGLKHAENQTMHTQKPKKYAHMQSKPKIYNKAMLFFFSCIIRRSSLLLGVGNMLTRNQNQRFTVKLCYFPFMHHQTIFPAARSAASLIRTGGEAFIYCHKKETLAISPPAELNRASPGPERRHVCMRRCATFRNLPRLFATLLCDVARLSYLIIANDLNTSIHMTSFFFVPQPSATFRDFARLVSATLPLLSMQRSGPEWASEWREREGVVTLEHRRGMQKPKPKQWPSPACLSESCSNCSVLVVVGLLKLVESRSENASEVAQSEVLLSNILTR
jgi:hypothetical protein